MEKYTYYYQSNTNKSNQSDKQGPGKHKKLSKRELARRRRKRRYYLKLFLRLGMPVIAIIIMIGLSIRLIVKSSKDENETVSEAPNISIEKTKTEEPVEEVISQPVISNAVYSAVENSSTADLPSDVVSGYGILIDLADNSILMQRNPHTRISPASMTKILTVLVAAEHITREQLDDKVTITIEYTDYSYGNDLSAVGFSENEVVTVRDLFYGTILPSGGDAAIALANYVAGSEEAFAELMNEKLKNLQLDNSTHFTNVAGMYADDHYSTVYDMAMIMHAAIDNEICREVLNAHTYTTSSTEQHPEGITISNWFLRRIEDKDCGLTVECAKTGFVVQSRNCAASFADDESGHGYICVTADSSSSWRCIYDHVSIYSSCSGLTDRPASSMDTMLPDDDSNNPDKPDTSTSSTSSSSSSSSKTNTSSSNKENSKTTTTSAQTQNTSATDTGTAGTTLSTEATPTPTPQIITPSVPQLSNSATGPSNSDPQTINDPAPENTDTKNNNTDKPSDSYDEIPL